MSGLKYKLKEKKCSLQTVILASNPPSGGKVLSHCRSAWERRQSLSSVAKWKR